MFFGIGASATALAAALGLGDLTAQTLVFLGVSLGALALFRRPLLARIANSTPPPQQALTGEIAVPMHVTPAHAVGQAELRGTVWSAHNLADRPLLSGERCRVERTEGLTIYLRPEN